MPIFDYLPDHLDEPLGVPASSQSVEVLKTYEVRQRGPRRLWAEVEAADRWRLDQGKPTVDQWRFTVSPDRQAADLR